MDKEWKLFPHSDCPICGGEAEVLTESTLERIVFDEDEVRCTDCGLSGFISVEDSECADIVWDEEHGGC